MAADRQALPESCRQTGCAPSSADQQQSLSFLPARLTNQLSKQALRSRALCNGRGGTRAVPSAPPSPSHHPPTRGCGTPGDQLQERHAETCVPVCLSAYLSGRIHLKITSGIKTALARACDSTSAAGSVNTESEDPDLFQPGNDPATIKHNTGRTVAAAVLPSHSHLGTYCPGDTPMLLLL